ncbi:hypothetical protein [Solidesulfovibrio sp.]|uniref:hypothetical protein n=1 Tax=Solidesulfovibrio sp. TaxID=2910990 RepID=UPI002B1FB6A7|nr:hypothetical protein [Solidesulfovibrio sp.]MEA5089264.1 hypothetical protein [Solidesulfovibrio sp.]
MCIIRFYEGTSVDDENDNPFVTEDNLLFWKIQYIKRNKRVQNQRAIELKRRQKLYKKVDSVTSILHADGYPPLFHAEYGPKPVNIIEQITAKTFKPKVHTWDPPDQYLVEFTVKPDLLLAEINWRGSKEKVLHQVSLMLDILHGKCRPVSTVETIKNGKGQEDANDYPMSIYNNPVYIIEKCCHKEEGDVICNNSDLSRAIGLWLWDCVHELGGKRGTKIKAIREIEKTFHTKNIELPYDSDYCYYLLRRTDECIEKCNVLGIDRKA